MRKLFFLFLLFITIFTCPIFAQEKQSDNAPELVSEFSKYSSEILEKELDAVAEYLNSDSKIQVLIYSGEKDLRGSRYRFATTVKTYLQNIKGLSPNKILIEQCGFKKEFKVQFYNFPIGTEKKPCVEEFSPINKTVLFDNLREVSEGCCAVDGFNDERVQGSFEGFIKYLKLNPQSKAFIIINSNGKIRYYDEKIDQERYLNKTETTNLINERLNKTKDNLVKADIDESRFEIFTGKMLKEEYGDFTWKLWVVPQGGEIPKEVAPYLKRKKSAKKR